MSLRIATVKYLNALPFLHALKELEKQKQLQLFEAIPSACSELLQDDQVDIALIPAGAIADFDKLFLISNYCISCDGFVRTVKLFSQHSIDDIQQIVLDPSSRSSNLLIQILCKYHWKKTELIFSNPDNQISNLKTGFLKIGDDVFDLENHYAFEYDLGNEWKIMTGLPFVFAMWVSKKRIEDKYLKILNEAFHSSLLNIPQIVSESFPLDKIRLDGYFEKNIYYEFDSERRKGILKFLELAGLKNPLDM